MSNIAAMPANCGQPYTGCDNLVCYSQYDCQYYKFPPGHFGQVIGVTPNGRPTWVDASGIAVSDPNGCFGVDTVAGALYELCEAVKCNNIKNCVGTGVAPERGLYYNRVTHTFGVSISPQTGNQLQQFVDGLYMKETDFTGVSSQAIKFTPGGVNGHAPRVDLKLSAQTGNQLAILNDGLYMKETDFTGIAGNGIAIDPGGTNGHAPTISMHAEKSVTASTALPIVPVASVASASLIDLSAADVSSPTNDIIPEIGTDGHRRWYIRPIYFSGFAEQPTSVPPNTLTAVPFAGAGAIDYANEILVSGGGARVPVSGIYSVNAACWSEDEHQWACRTNLFVGLTLMINGIVDSEISRQPVPQNYNQCVDVLGERSSVGSTGSTIVRLDAGDVVSLSVLHSDDTAIDFDVDMSIHYISAS